MPKCRRRRLRRQRRSSTTDSNVIRLPGVVIIDAMSLQERARAENLDYYQLLAAGYYSKLYRNVSKAEREQMKSMMSHVHYGTNSEQFARVLKQTLPSSTAPWMCSCNRVHPSHHYRCKKCREQAPYRRAL